MKILLILPVSGHIVETDEAEHNRYTRYSSNCWTVTMGESEEPVYDCEELEKEFQKNIKK